MAAVGESQLQRIIKDLHDAVVELAKEYREGGEPITDDSSGLHKLSFKLEYLLQFDQKEKATFLGTRKDYWDYFSDCLSKIRGANDGIRFVKSIPELKTSLGKGRALIRYSLVHQRLADTLQQCLMNKRITSDWYYARSPFLKPHLSADIISHLYELNEMQFDVASRGHDLDASWPTFARRTLGMANSPSHMWTAPSRSSSVSSLASCYSQQAHECPLSPDYGHGLLDDLNESLPTSGNEDSAVEDLRLELDQSELKHRDLLDRVQQLAEEAAELRGVVVELQRQLDASLAAQEEQQGLQRALEALQGKEEELRRELPALRAANSAQEAEQRHLRERLTTAEGKNLELMAKLDGVLDEKGQQAASHFDSAQKIHELLDRLKDAERGKIEAVAEMEETKKQAQRTAAELRDRDAMEGEAEKKLGMLTKSSAEESTLLESKVAEQSSTLEKLQAALTVKDEEASRLQKQLEDLQRSLENEARKAQEAAQQAHKERDTHQRTMGQLKESTEEALCSLKEQLSSRETELISGTRRLQQAEARSEALSEERDGLSVSLREQRAGAAELAKKLCDYETRCASLVELNEQMLGASKRNEKLQEDLVKSRVALEAEMATLRSSEKQLRGQLDDSKVTVDEKEKRLREENRRLDESFQRATMAAEMTGAASKQLEKENQSLREEQAAVKTALGTMQAELKAIHSNIGELERSLGESRKSEASLQGQLQANKALLDRKEKDCAELEAAVKTLKGREKQLEAACAQQATLAEKVTAESSARANESLEASSGLGVVEGLLDVSMKEVARHQAAVLDLQIQLQRSGEENAKAQAGLDATEVQRDELRTLSEQLHAELKEVNQRHVADLLQCKEREAAARAELAVSEAASRDELSALKAQNERLSLEGSETRDGLHRANTEMAELGMTICRLTAEKEEAQERRAEDAARIEELEECTAKELALLEDSVAALRQENAGLKDKLLQTEALTGTLREVQEKLETAEGQLTMFRDSSREEVEAIKFQMSSESMNHQTQIKSMSEELTCVKATLQMELEKVSSLEVKVSELEGVNEKYSRLIVEKDSHITRSEATIRHGEGEVQQLRYSVTSTEEAFLAVQKSHEELKQKLNEAELEKQSNYLKMTSEIDDLCRTKTILEERLIELIKDKDALWQKSDALEFEQKLRAEENWWLVDKEATHCLSCQGQFTWWLRRHHCRLCGRIFCYYCSNHQAMFKHSGKKERCCRECYSQHSAVVEKEAELSPSDTQPTPPAEGPPSSPAPAPCRPTPRAAVSDPNNRSEEGAYDIITEEEVNGVYDSDSMSQTTRGSLEGEPDRRHPGSLDIGTGENLDDPEEHVPTIQDAEINLLQSGEATLVVPLTIEDICTFGDGSRELFVKSSCYSVLAIAVADHGPTINWVFSSEPRSISFSVVYREAQDTPVEQSKVLIPLMRCSSHKETIQGQLKVRNPGLYTLIFDNSFSRFISKTVLYRLTMEQPIIYDGTDFP